MFNEDKFKTDLKNSLRITTVSSYHVFEKVFLKVFGRHAPMKTKQSELIMHHMSQKLWEKQYITKRTGAVDTSKLDLKWKIQAIQMAKKFL